MLFRSSPEKFWDLIATQYAASPIKDMQAYEKKITQLKTYLKPSYTILDIGCGTGTQCMDLSDSVTHVTGVDHSTRLLKVAEQRKIERKLDNVNFVKASLDDMNFPAREFDVVMAFYVLHFCEDVEELFQRIHSWLKPGGLLITESYCLGEKNIFQRFWLRFAGLIGIMPLISLLTYKQLEQILINTGFTLVEKTQFSTKFNEYTLIARKLEKS